MRCAAAAPAGARASVASSILPARGFHSRAARVRRSAAKRIGAGVSRPLSRVSLVVGPGSPRLAPVSFSISLSPPACWSCGLVTFSPRRCETISHLLGGLLLGLLLAGLLGRLLGGLLRGAFLCHVQVSICFRELVGAAKRNTSADHPPPLLYYYRKRKERGLTLFLVESLA